MIKNGNTEWLSNLSIITIFSVANVQIGWVVVRAVLSYLAFMSLSLIAFTLIWDTNPPFYCKQYSWSVGIINTELRGVYLHWRGCLTPLYDFQQQQHSTRDNQKYRMVQLRPNFLNLEFFYKNQEPPLYILSLWITKNIVQNTTRTFFFLCVPTWEKVRNRTREENHWEQIAPKPLSVRNSKGRNEVVKRKMICIVMVLDHHPTLRLHN